MSIASELTRLQNAKNAISNAIKNKGVSVPSGTKLDGMAPLIGQIQTGSSFEIAELRHGYATGARTYYTDTNGQGQYHEGHDRVNVPMGSYFIVDSATVADNMFCTDCEVVQAYEIDDIYDDGGMGPYYLVILKVTGPYPDCMF